LLDLGSCFLELGQLAANSLYHAEVPGAGINAQLAAAEGEQVAEGALLLRLEPSGG